LAADRRRPCRGLRRCRRTASKNFFDSSLGTVND
jgi:hypothetical protein